MYSNDITQIKMGLANYVGAMLSAAGNDQVGRQHVVAILLEEALKLSQPETSCDLFVLKPLIRAIIFVLKQRIAELSKLSVKEAKEQIVRYQTMINEFDALLNNLKGGI